MKEYTFTASDNKIQAITWSDDPIKKLVKIFDLYFLQAKSMDLNSKELIRVPGASKRHIDQIIEALYLQKNTDTTAFNRIDPHYMTRHRNIIYLATVLALVPAVVYKAVFTIVFITVVSMYWLTLTYLFYKKYTLSYSSEFLFIRKGQLGNIFTLAPIAHIQSIRINQSPYQRRNKLATLHFHFSSHQESIPYIPLAKAYDIANDLLYTIEHSAGEK
jgi:putative membrane protein